MKITHPSGEPYDLFPDTEIELTRFNPFFHELGEQSVPLSMPATSKNLLLLSHPERADNINRPDSRLNVQIQSGAFSVVGRQAILSAQANGNIETSFYLHDGAFYEKIKDVMLSEIFKAKKINFTSIDAAIDFMYSLVPGTDSRFAVFEVATDNYTLNNLRPPVVGDQYAKFVNEVETEEIIDGKTVIVPKGFYLTPFIKFKYVLIDVLSYLGYTLAPSFLDQEPFSRIVFLNNNLDTIVSNSINYIDVIPDISVKTLFDIIRKFDVELRVDEINKIIHLVSFDEALNSVDSVDLTKYAISKPVVNYHNQYKQLKLSSEQINLPEQISALIWYRNRRYTYDTGTPQETDVDFMSILSKYPTCYLQQEYGYIVRDGVSGINTFVEKIIHLGSNYYAGDSLPVEEHSFPDVVPATYGRQMYVGAARALQSRIVFQDETGTNEVADSSKLQPMLSLYYSVGTNCIGTIHNYDSDGNKLWDNSITWNGPDGLYEKFWRKRDTLLRNALLQLDVDMLLPEDLKQTLSAVNRKSFNNQKYLISEINYSTKRDSTANCKLLSTKLQQPVSESKLSIEYFRKKIYKWVSKYTCSWTSIPGHPTVFKFIKEPMSFYPPDPTAAEIASGGKYYQRIYNVEYGRTDGDDNFVKLGDGTVTTWLEPTLYQ